VQVIKVGFANYYNWRHHQRGYSWGRFKISIVGQGETLVNCLIYIDLNPYADLLRTAMYPHPAAFPGVCDTQTLY
jgi:hypothetical protein